MWLFIARSLIILQAASQMDLVGHTETRGSEQSDGELSSLPTEILEPRKCLVSARNLFPCGASFAPYLSRGQSSALPIASPSSSSHNVGLDKIVPHRTENYNNSCHIYHFLLYIEEGSTGMTSPGLQHAGEVGLEALKITILMSHGARLEITH